MPLPVIHAFIGLPLQQTYRYYNSSEYRTNIGKKMKKTIR